MYSRPYDHTRQKQYELDEAMKEIANDEARIKENEDSVACSGDQELADLITAENIAVADMRDASHKNVIGSAEEQAAAAKATRARYAAILAGQSCSHIRPKPVVGRCAVITGLAKADLNGHGGFLVCYDEVKDRYGIQIMEGFQKCGNPLLLRPQNLVLSRLPC